MSIIEKDGQLTRETWPNGGQTLSFCGSCISVSGLAPNGKFWSKSINTSANEQSMNLDAIITRGKKSWILKITEEGPVWISYRKKG